MWSTAVKAPNRRVSSRASIASARVMRPRSPLPGRAPCSAMKLSSIVGSIGVDLGVARSPASSERPRSSAAIAGAVLGRHARSRVVQRFAERVDGVRVRVARGAHAAAVALAPRTASSGRSKRAPMPRGRVDGEDASALDEGDAVAAVGFVHVRRRDDDREATARERRQQVPELAARYGVDAGRRLVEEQDLGPMHERAARAPASASCRRRARPRAGRETARAARRSAR